MSLVEAIKDSNLKEIDRILSKDASSASRVDGQGWTPAFYAALWGNLQALERLYACLPSVLSASVATNGDNAAHIAARFAQPNRLVLQWMWKTDRTLFFSGNRFGRSAISMIAENFKIPNKNAEEWLEETAKEASDLGALLSSSTSQPPSAECKVAASGKDITASYEHSIPRQRLPSPSRPSWLSPDASQAMPTSRHVHQPPSDVRSKSGPYALTNQGLDAGRITASNWKDDVRRGETMGGVPNPSNVPSHQKERWEEEFNGIRNILLEVFGPSATDSLLGWLRLTPDSFSVQAMNPEPGAGFPLGYSALSARNKKAVDELIRASKHSDAEGMELAVERLAPDCDWSHADIYRVLAVADSKDDRQYVNETLARYAVHMSSNQGWDPVMLLVAARAQAVQRGGRRSTDIRHVLCKMYHHFFPQQANTMLSAKDLAFIENCDNGGGESLFVQLLRKGDSKEAADEWKDLKAEHNFDCPSMDALMHLIGLKQVKAEALVFIKKLLAERNLTARQRVPITSNFTFMGNPGTGKTSVAKLFAKILVEIGFRKKQDMVEATGQRLVQDGAIKADATIQSAMDGVLFIDEAHSLDPKLNRAEGSAIVTKLLKAAEDDRERISIILAGYQDDIEEKLYAFDQGFRSRFQDIVFADYTEDELRQILVTFIHDKDWKMQDERKLADVVARRIARSRGTKNFGNARTVRSVVEGAIKAACMAHRAPNLKIEDFLGPRPSRENIPELNVALQELEQMIGMQDEADSNESSTKRSFGMPAKKAVDQLLKTVQANYDKELNGEKPLPLSLNRLFLGNPGTGKTTVAEIYGLILKHLHLLSNGSVVLKRAGDFIVGHEGGTEQKTLEILDNARGKVLVIDEAYELCKSNYGRTAIDMLVSKFSGGAGEDIAVLLLGYEKEMMDMLNREDVNPGLKSRFNPEDAFYFADFNDADLLRVLKMKLSKDDLSMGLSVRSRCIQLLAAERNKLKFGNARSVENLLNRAKLAMSARDPLTRVIIMQDVGKSAMEAGAGGDPFEALKGMFNTDSIAQALREVQADMQFKLKRGEEVKVHNFLFVGNPGTGKTRVARIMAKIMSQMGLLEDKDIVETTALEIQGQYVGQSQAKAREKMTQARGGVLFLDEAHNLSNSQFSVEAAKVLMTATLEPEHDSKTMIILAGYEDKMHHMMQTTDEGMARRFPGTIRFPDWPPQVCLDYVCKLCQESDLQLEPDAAAHVLAKLKIIHSRPGWGNAGDANTTYSKLKSALASRVMNVSAPCTQESVITLVDAVHAMDKFLLERPPAIAKINHDVNVVRMEGCIATSELDAPPIENVETNTKTKEHQTSLESQTRVYQVEEDDKDGEEDIDAALQLACVELGYDRDHDSRKQLRGILEAVDAGGEFPLDVLEYIKKKTGRNETRLVPVLRRQVPPLLLSVSRAVEEEERRLEEIRVLEMQKRAEEAERLRREHEGKMRKLRTMGLCPAGYSWYRHGSMWYCLGGSHSMPDSSLR